MIRDAIRLLIPLFMFIFFIYYVSNAEGSLRLSTTQPTVEAENEGDTATARISVVNDGSSPIKVIRVATSCHCTSLSFDRQSFAPGDNGWLTIVVNTDGHSGSFERVAYFETDDPQQPNQTLHIIVKVGLRPATTMPSTQPSAPQGP